MSGGDCNHLHNLLLGRAWRVDAKANRFRVMREAIARLIARPMRLLSALSGVVVYF